MQKNEHTVPVIKMMFILFFLSACGNSNDRKEIIVTDFNNKFIDSLVPNKKESYSTYYIHIEGYANDSIRIKPGKETDNYYYFYFKDSINEELKMDYYGGETRYFLFDPYKADNGKIEITYKLL